MYPHSVGFYDGVVWMAEKIRIIEMSRVGGDVLITFSDGRVTTLDIDALYGNSKEPPPELDMPVEVDR